MTRLAILGAAGRMGSALVRCAQQLDTVDVAVAIDRQGHPAIGRDAGVVAGHGSIGVAISDDLATVRSADVLIDFTSHTAVPRHVQAAVDAGRAVVIGTTGLDEAETAAVHAAAKVVPVVWAPNMSLGVNLLFELVRQAAAVLGLDYDAEITETHHRHKTDAPSGTALGLAKAVAAGRQQQLADVACWGREGQVGARPKGEIGVHAIRAGDVIGDHTVILAGDNERLELSHRASSRDAFAMGALRAAHWAAQQPAGLYGMNDVLGL
ncbi:MAG: 4-hydroxy-tetrahydrodipicolinate reductase [Verrucomicrobia bacterium]|nr:4-hydroxy-tetrahydrodipicolinate reductase [Verrucomicrobiota bacterium]